MQKLILFILILLFAEILNAQNKKNEDVKYFARDQVIFDLNYNYWIDDDNITQQKLNSYGCSFYTMYNLLGRYSNVCFAAGFGLSMENINLETQPYDSAGFTHFVKIPSNIEYQKNKIALTYLDVPVEIRIRTNPNEKRKSFKIFLGGKFGYLINNHLKYIGEDLVTGKWVKYKKYYLPNISTFRYGLSCRIGFGKFNVTGFYALSSLFEENKSPEIYPVNIGLSMILY